MLKKLACFLLLLVVLDIMTGVVRNVVDCVDVDIVDISCGAATVGESIVVLLSPIRPVVDDESMLGKLATTDEESGFWRSRMYSHANATTLKNNI